jgi:hypothetical protein
MLVRWFIVPQALFLSAPTSDKVLGYHACKLLQKKIDMQNFKTALPSPATTFRPWPALPQPRLEKKSDNNQAPRGKTKLFSFSLSYHFAFYLSKPQAKT